MMFSSLCREPLAIGAKKADTAVKSGLEPAQEASMALVANPPSEPAKTMADVAKDDVVPPDAPPLIVDHGSSAASDGDEIVVEVFEAAPRPRTVVEGGAFRLPSSTVEETAKDDAMALVSGSLPGPR